MPKSNVPRVSTGCEGLDDILHGGLTSNHLYLIEGEPGTGKTTLALQFLLDGVSKGEAGLYITLSESPAELRGVAESHGWDLGQISIFEMAAPTAESLEADEYTVFHPSDVELGDTMRSVLDHVAATKPVRIVFDSLSELRMLARESLRYRRHILALKRYFADKDITVVLLDDRTAEGHDLQLQSIAHGVIMLESLDREYGVKRRRLEVRKMRGSKFREGFHDYTIETGGVRVYPRLVAGDKEKKPHTELLCSGVPELDALFAGGIDYGTSTLLLGPAGSGKSSVALQYACAAAAGGAPACVYLFDETMETMSKRSKGMGLDLDTLLQNGSLRVIQLDPAEISPGEFALRLAHDVTRSHTRVVVIDSFNGLINAMPGEQFMILQIHEILSFLNRHGIATLITVAQHGMLGKMETPIDVSYLADSVLLFRFFEAHGRIRKALSVVKKRRGAHEDTIREMIISDRGVQVGAPLVAFRGVLTGVPEYMDKDHSA